MIFFSSSEQAEQRILAHMLLHKTWWYYNKFDSTKSLGVYYWYVKIPQCGYVEQGLKDFAF